MLQKKNQFPEVSIAQVANALFLTRKLFQLLQKNADQMFGTEAVVGRQGGKVDQRPDAQHARQVLGLPELDRFSSCVLKLNNFG